MTNKIFAFLTAKNEENQQALVFEELSDSETSIIAGGQQILSLGFAIAVAVKSLDDSIIRVG